MLKPQSPRSLPVLQLVFLIPVLLPGCSVYSPSVSPPVLITEKNEVQVDASISTSYPGTYSFVPSGFNASIAYGIFDHTSIQVSASRILGGYNRIEMTTGYYLPFSNRFKIGFFPGLSHGHVFTWELVGYSMGIPEYVRWKGDYLAPSSKFQMLYKNEWIACGLGVKGSIYIPDISRSNTQLDPGNALLLEPSVFLIPSVAKLPVGITFIGSFSRPYPMRDGSPDFNSDYALEYPGFTFGLGLNFRINTQ